MTVATTVVIPLARWSAADPENDTISASGLCLGIRGGDKDSSGTIIV
jgi:hypothetical protein